MSGITSAGKTYDGTTLAALDTSNAVFSNLVAGESINLAAIGAFADANAGNGKTVGINSSYGGDFVANYLITGQASTTASMNLSLPLA